MHLTRMAAKAAIERAFNELARFFEREQARQDVKAAIKREQSDASISSAECEQARPKVNIHNLIFLIVAYVITQQFELRSALTYSTTSKCW